jgi:hypothetical protein
MKVLTRVTSPVKASSCRSNIKRACSANDSGLSAGRLITGTSALCEMARAMRRSTSRTLSRYPEILVRSAGPTRLRKLATSPTSESRMLLRSCRRRRRAPLSVLALSPNNRSNAAVGDCSIGNGDSGPAHAMVPV